MNGPEARREIEMEQLEAALRADSAEPRQAFAAEMDRRVQEGFPKPPRRQEQLIAESLASGRSVVVDNTNPSAAVRAPLIAAARTQGADVVGYFFITAAGDALRRNRAREGRERVPDVAIFTARKRLEAPTQAEGFDRLFSVRMDEADRTFEVTPM